MARLCWAILVERAIVEQDTNNLSLISIVDEVRLKQPPAQVLAEDKPPLVPHRFTLVQLWERSSPDKPEKILVRSRMKGPQGQVYATVEQEANLEGYLVCRVMTRAVGFPLFGEGEYPIEISASTNGKTWRKVGRQRFKVVFTHKGQVEASGDGKTH